MPRAADPTVRIALIEAAARILAEEGAAALTLRRVANEVGTSTMAVYTHFGGMDDLRRAVRRQGFERLAVRLADATNGAADPTNGDDPVARLVALAIAYFHNAIENPHLYRAMFIDRPVDGDNATEGYDTFLTMIDAIAECIDAGRFRPANPVDLATQLWMGGHGGVSLQIAGMVRPGRAFAACMDYLVHLLVGFGDERELVQGAIDRAMASDAPPRSLPRR